MPIDFKRIQSVFQAVAELPPAERVAALARECGDDAELRRQVEALLRAHDDPGELPAAEPGPTGAYVPAVEAGQVFAGRYKLREKLGEGGMGVVFVADQLEPVQRRVALKIIRAGLDTQRLLARFEQERQALALMDHPNIAKVFDAGVVGHVSNVSPSEHGHVGNVPHGGTPYFAMELVKGLPLTKYSDDARLSPRQRLELFIPVCQAVQHAHQKGIIHRDLKPSNVLVGLYDGRPVPKVIDFGVAKATGPRLTEQSIYTEVGSIIGTLEYMSPEQAELNNLDIDTRSDVYALGVILYELLTGAVPFSRKELEKAGLAEMLRVIKEAEPPRPSTKLSHSGTLATVAAQRQMEPKKLTALVRGELDWIVMKALEKDRSRRYETANGFAMDVQRYLAGDPVLAAPASKVYRLKKFVRRHRGPVVAAGVVLLTLLGGVAGTTWGLLRAERQRQVAVEERDAKDKALVAEKQARGQAMTALRAMTDEIVENQMARGTTLTEENKAYLRWIIKHFEGLAAITGDDAESRAIRAEGNHRVGLMRQRLGELEGAEAAYADGLSIYKQLTDDFPTRSEFRQNLAKSYNNLGVLFRETGRLAEAETAYTKGLAIDKQLVADFPTQPEHRKSLAASYINVGVLFQTTGRMTQAEAAYVEAQAIYRQLTADFPKQAKYWQELAKCHNNLAILLEDTGRLKEAEAAQADALAIRMKLATDFPASHQVWRELAIGHNELGALFSATGRLQEAEAAYNEALAIRKQLAADFPTRPEFREELAASHHSLGNLLGATGRLTQAEAAYANALTIKEQLARDFPKRPEFRQQCARSHGELGILFNNAGRLKEAEASLTEALRIQQKLALEFHSSPVYRKDLAVTQTNLGCLLRDTGRLAAAETSFTEALAIQKQLVADFPKEHAFRNNLVVTLVNLAILHNRRLGFTSAKSYLQEATPHHEAALKANPRHPTYRKFYAINLKTLIQANAGLGDRIGAKQAAEEIQALGWSPAADAYIAACALSTCIPIATGGSQHAQFYGDEAMKMLKDAVAKGFKDAAHVKKDKDLDPLREREDFKKLLAELEGK